MQLAARPSTLRRVHALPLLESCCDALRRLHQPAVNVSSACRGHDRPQRRGIRVPGALRRLNRRLETLGLSGCTSLTAVTIGDSVTSLGYRVFGSCTSLARARRARS